MEIRHISNEDFLQLVVLTVDMYKSLEIGVNPFQAVNTLMHCATKEKNFVAIGLYEDEELVGFITGHEHNAAIFYFSCLYMKEKNNKNLKYLIDYSLEYIEQSLGYRGWVLDANNENMASMAEKYGAVMHHIRYKKVF